MSVAGSSVEVAEILLVEDRGGSGSPMQQGFEDSKRFRLTVVGSLREARVEIRRQRWDLVIADFQLPDGESTRLLELEMAGLDDDSRRDLHLGPKLPLVVLTGPGDELAAAHVIKAGALDCVPRAEGVMHSLPQMAELAIRDWRHVLALRRAERRQRHSECRLRRIVETAQEGIWMLDPQGKTTFTNRQLWRILGRQQPSKDLDIEEVFGHESGLVSRVMLPIPVKLREVSIGLPDGSRRWLRLSSGPVFDEDQQSAGAVLTLTDITQEREAAEALRRQEAELAHVTRISTLGELVAQLAHEVNQPLSAIANTAVGCQKTLEKSDHPDGNKLREWVRVISQQAQRASEIIQRVRRFMKQNAPPSSCRLSEIVREAIELVASEAQRNRIGLRLIVGRQAEEAVVQVDRVQIQQVLINLLQNAYDAVKNQSEAVRRVDIHILQCAPHQIQVDVSDSGPGVPADSQASVFEAFYTTKAQGLGMGLAVCRSIVANHGGEIWLTSPDRAFGATFHVLLPTIPTLTSDSITVSS